MKTKTEKSQTANYDECTVYISNLSYKIDRFKLKKIFSNFGEVRQVKLVMDLETQKSKGMAFVRMSEASEAKAAIEGLDKQIIDGRTVKVARAIPMKKSATPKFKPEPEVKIEKVKSKDKVEKVKKRGPVPLKEFLAQKSVKKIKK